MVRANSAGVARGKLVASGSDAPRAAPADVFPLLVREVRANLVYRQFTPIGLQRMPHAKTIGKLGLRLGPTVVQPLHQARGRSGPGRESNPRPQTAGGYHRGRDQYPLPHR